jgi:hypothetical protein
MNPELIYNIELFNLINIECIGDKFRGKSVLYNLKNKSLFFCLLLGQEDRYEQYFDRTKMLKLINSLNIFSDEEILNYENEISIFMIWEYIINMRYNLDSVNLMKYYINIINCMNLSELSSFLSELDYDNLTECHNIYSEEEVLYLENLIDESKLLLLNNINEEEVELVMLGGSTCDSITQFALNVISNIFNYFSNRDQRRIIGNDQISLSEWRDQRSNQRKNRQLNDIISMHSRFSDLGGRNMPIDLFERIRNEAGEREVMERITRTYSRNRMVNLIKDHERFRDYDNLMLDEFLSQLNDEKIYHIFRWNCFYPVEPNRISEKFIIGREINQALFEDLNNIQRELDREEIVDEDYIPDILDEEDDEIEQHWDTRNEYNRLRLTRGVHSMRPSTTMSDVAVKAQLDNLVTRRSTYRISDYEVLQLLLSTFLTDPNVAYQIIDKDPYYNYPEYIVKFAIHFIDDNIIFHSGPRGMNIIDRATGKPYEL